MAPDEQSPTNTATSDPEDRSSTTDPGTGPSEPSITAVTERALWRCIATASQRISRTEAATLEHEATAVLSLIGGALAVPGITLIEHEGETERVVARYGVLPTGADTFTIPLPRAPRPGGQAEIGGVLVLMDTGQRWDALLPMLRVLADLFGLALQRARVESVLAERDRLYRVLTHTAADLVTIIDTRFRFAFVSPASYPLLGYQPAELAALSPLEVVHPADRDVVLHHVRAARAGDHQPFYLECRMRCADGTYRWVESNVTPTVEPESGRIELHVSTRDITRHKRAQEALALQATHDPLTELPNRRLFVAGLIGALDDLRRQPGLVAVLFIDLDGFKDVNDRYGHEVGDLALLAIARRLRGVVRPGDLVGRHGGDEFTVGLRRLRSTSEATAVAERMLEALSQPVDVASHRTQLGASIGIAIARSADSDPHDLLRQADAAMYKAKSEGGNRWSMAGSA